MTTAISDTGTHPVTALVARVHDELDHLEATYWSMSEKDLAATLPALTRLRQRVTAVELGVAHAADTTGLGTEVGAADTGAFWANATRQPKGSPSTGSPWPPRWTGTRPRASRWPRAGWPRTRRA
jgi:hypothetical protein